MTTGVAAFRLDNPLRRSHVSGVLPFADRACFIAGPAKSGTSLWVSLLDGHPELLVLPEETAYFPTALRKHAGDRRGQFNHLTGKALCGILFGGRGGYEKHDYSHFDAARFRADFERAAFDPANAGRDLLVLLFETYARMLGRPLEAVRRWVEKTPANRAHLPAIFTRFPQAKVILTLRDPRALLAAQIKLEQSLRRRRFSIYLCMEHWRTAAQLALHPDPRIFVASFERLLRAPAENLQRVCAFLDIAYDPAMLTPTKAGRPWVGNSTAGHCFQSISPEPIDRWRTFLTESEIAWVEHHCRALMLPLGYEPLLPRTTRQQWAAPVRGETPKEYLKSRWLSISRP